MSSDTFRIRVNGVEARNVTLTIIPTTAAGLTDLAYTRSFVAMLLYDVGGPTLFNELLKPEWNQAHLDEYVRNTQVISVIGMRYERHIRDCAEQFTTPIQWLQPHLTLVAEMATEELAGYFQSTSSFGTTAFDAWYDDPKRPKLPEEWARPSTFAPDPGLIQRIFPLVRARLPQWATKGHQTLCQASSTGSLQLHVTFESPSYSAPIREHFMLRALLEMPALRDRYVSARSPGSTILGHTSVLPTPPVIVWCKSCDIYTSYPESVAQESDEELADRVVEALGNESIATWLDPNGAAALVEDLCEAMVKRFKVTTFKRLRPAGSPSPWSWYAYDSDIFWIRVAMYGEMGDDAAAKEAALQAQGRWKKVPKWITGELSRLGV